MAVYVDNGNMKFKIFRFCHMMADSLEELHAMADKIGIDRKWYQPKSTPHYDISQTMRARAIRHGAIEADKKKIVELIRFWREHNV